MQHHSNHIQRNPLHLVNMRSEHMSQRMWGKCNGASLSSLKNEAMTKKAHTSGDGLIIEMSAFVLKEIWSRFLEAAGAIVPWGKRHGRRTFPWLGLIMFLQKNAHLLPIWKGFSPHCGVRAIL